MHMTTHFILTGLAGYLLGSIPWSVWIGRAWYGLDIRQHGSGNAGATNTFRILGKKAGILVLILDTLKGFVPAFLPPFIFTDAENSAMSALKICGGASAVLGHVYSVFLKFRGGKGVATSLGMMLAIAPLATLLSAGVFLGVWLATSYISLGSMSAAAVFPFWHYLLYPHASSWQWASVLTLSVLIFWTHRSNIRKLIRGQESKIYPFKSRKALRKI